MAEQKPFVYFLAPIEGGAIKIGCSYLPIERLRTMLCWSPVPLEILATAPGTQADERFLHSRFAADRIHSEWFRPSARLLDMIDRIKASGQLDRTISHVLPIPPKGFDLVWRLNRVLEAHKITLEEIAEAAGVASIKQWTRQIPSSRIGWFIEYMRDRGVSVDVADLYEFVPRPPAESFRRPQPIARAGLDYVHAQLDALLSNEGICARKRIPDLKLTASTLFEMLPTTFWPKPKEIALRTNIKRSRINHLLGELVRYRLVRMSRGPLRSVAFDLQIEEYWPAERPKLKAA